MQVNAAADFISIHSPHTGRDCCSLGERKPFPISIHSPHTGRDHPAVDAVMPPLFNFNPLSPHGERRLSLACPLHRIPFQSTLPTRGETLVVHHQGDGADISIHSPHTGRDRGQEARIYAEYQFQSTLPTRGETARRAAFSRLILLFQSTLPTRGETISLAAFVERRIFQSTLPTRGETQA